MRCDTFLTAVETGRLLVRVRARHHARHCPRCAAAYRSWMTLKAQWAVAEPLSPRSRRLWETALTEPGPVRQRPAVWVPLGAALAAACVLLIVLLQLHRPASDTAIVPTGPGVPSGPVVIEPIDSAVELSRLVSAVDRLDQQIERLKELAVRRDAERQVALTRDRYEKW